MFYALKNGLLDNLLKLLEEFDYLITLGNENPNFDKAVSNVSSTSVAHAT